MSTLEDHAFLRRAYLEFLNVIVTHGQQDVLATERNAPHAPEVLAAVLEGSGAADPKGYKICFGMFKCVRPLFSIPLLCKSVLRNRVVAPRVRTISARLVDMNMVCTDMK